MDFDNELQNYGILQKVTKTIQMDFDNELQNYEKLRKVTKTIQMDLYYD